MIMVPSLFTISNMCVEMCERQVSEIITCVMSQTIGKSS